MIRFAAALFLAMPLLLPAWQTPPTSFEVAEIKPSDPSVMKAGKGRMLPGGQIQVPGYTLRELIMFATGATEEMISGGPKWVGQDRFDIVAKAPAGAPNSALKTMLQALLRDRFKLVTHQEDRPVPAYVLSMAKDAAPMRESSETGNSQCRWTDLEAGLRRRECTNVTMEEFAKELPRTGGIGISLPVADQTGLKGRYDFQFEVGSMRSQADPFDTDGPNIFAALKKVGLHLEGKKIPMPVVVIDSAERPSEN